MICAQCDAVLRHQPNATFISEYGTVHHHYRCPAGDCSAEAGTVITSDGEITRKVGPATNPAHGLLGTDRSQQEGTPQRGAALNDARRHQSRRTEG